MDSYRYSSAPVEDSPPAIRCHMGLDGLITAIPDDYDAQMFDQLNIDHLKSDQVAFDTTGLWFASAITALGTSSQTILWNYKIPPEVLSFAKKDTIPCGVLVLLDVVEESATPDWATQYTGEEEAEREATFRRMTNESRAIQRENQMPPDQKAQAVRDRQVKRHDDWVASLNEKRRRDTQRAESRMLEAMQSPKWDNRLVAGHNLTWLKQRGHVDETHNLRRAVEVLLWKMVNKPEMAANLAKMLDGWKAFVDNGGVRKADYMLLKEDQITFAHASLVLAAIEDSVTAAHGSLAMDLQECVRIWKKVRLG